ncbi:MAG: O-antigen ligase family protein [Acidimicrobiia bacterium]
MSTPPTPGPDTRQLLEELSVPELRKLAWRHEIQGRSRMRKAELVAELVSVVEDHELRQADISIVLTPLPIDQHSAAASDASTAKPPEVEAPADKAPEVEAPTAKAPEVEAPEVERGTIAVSQPISDEGLHEASTAGADGGPSPAIDTSTAPVVAAPEVPDVAPVKKRQLEAPTSRRTRLVSVGSLYERDGSTTPMMGKATFALVVLYLILNRLISDGMVLPIGISLRLYEVVLILVGIAWVLWMLDEPLPLPYGAPALTGLVLVVLVGLAPFIHGPGLNAYQANGAERGLFRMFMFIALFLAAYHIAFRRRPGLVLLGIIVASTVGQALFALYEFITERPVLLLDNIALAIGLIPDPLSIRSDGTDVFQRLTGEIRAVATAPHPIILSAVIAVAALIVAMWILNVRTARAKWWLALAGVILFFGLPLANSRTGFVIIVGLALPLLLLATPRLPTVIRWSIPVLFAMAIAFTVSPETPRLLLNSFTDPGSDPNTQIRLERLDRLPELTAERPFLGAGYLTHDPAIQIFDNGYNLALVELGILGLAAFLAFVMASLIRSWSGAVRAGPDEIILPIAGVIAALALLVGGTTFDAWTFDQFFPTCICLLGLGLGRSAVILRRGSEEKIEVQQRRDMVDA